MITPYWDFTEEESVSAEDQRWLDNELLDARRAFPDEVYAAQHDE
jgi:hypothetical protein